MTRILSFLGHLVRKGAYVVAGRHVGGGGGGGGEIWHRASPDGSRSGRRSGRRERRERDELVGVRIFHYNVVAPPKRTMTRSPIPKPPATTM
jgi:hypothetical protein